MQIRSRCRLRERKRVFDAAQSSFESRSILSSSCPRPPLLNHRRTSSPSSDALQSSHFMPQNVARARSILIAVVNVSERGVRPLQFALGRVRCRRPWPGIVVKNWAKICFFTHQRNTQGDGYENCSDRGSDAPLGCVSSNPSFLRILRCSIR